MRHKEHLIFKKNILLASKVLFKVHEVLSSVTEVIQQAIDRTSLTLSVHSFFRLDTLQQISIFYFIVFTRKILITNPKMT